MSTDVQVTPMKDESDQRNRQRLYVIASIGNLITAAMEGETISATEQSEVTRTSTISENENARDSVGEEQENTSDEPERDEVGSEERENTPDETERDEVGSVLVRASVEVAPEDLEILTEPYFNDSEDFERQIQQPSHSRLSTFADDERRLNSAVETPRSSRVLSSPSAPPRVRITNGIRGVFGSRTSALQNCRKRLLKELKIDKKSEKKSRSSESEIENVLRQCVVCMENDYNIVIRPCNHLSTCTECSTKIDKCPTCRGPMEDFLKVYPS